MSVCASVKTAKTFEPETLFDKLVDNGESIMVTSTKFPTLRFGTMYEAIRGVEVSKEDDGYEVRVCSMSSAADYQLFGRVVDAVVEITEGVFYDENDEVPVGQKASDFYDEEWIALHRESDMRMVKVLISNSGETITMYGLFAPFCIGPHFLAQMDIDIYGDDNDEDADNLQDYLCQMQWMLADEDDTGTSIVIPRPGSENPQDGKSVSLISIKDGAVEEFDYISYANLFCIMDFDGSEDCGCCPAMLHFRELWKIIPNDVFKRWDEYQYQLKGELTVDMVHQMLKDSRHLQSQELHKDPTYPGFGHDEEQQTVILMWNPDISNVKLDDHNANIRTMLSEFFNWSVWEHDKAKIGDKFYLVRCGSGRTGIVMSGVFDSNPYELGDWSGRGRQTFYMDMLPNVMLNPERAPMITTEELEQAIPSFNWQGGHSGRLLTQEEAKTLEDLWAKFIDEHSGDIDHETLNMTTMH